MTRSFLWIRKKAAVCQKKGFHEKDISGCGITGIMNEAGDPLQRGADRGLDMEEIFKVPFTKI